MLIFSNILIKTIVARDTVDTTFIRITLVSARPITEKGFDMLSNSVMKLSKLVLFPSIFMKSILMPSKYLICLKSLAEYDLQLSKILDTCVKYGSGSSSFLVSSLNGL